MKFFLRALIVFGTLPAPVFARQAAGPPQASFIDFVPALLLIILGLSVYFLPTIIAFRRQHENKVAIFLLNWLAFTLVLWVIALVWSVKNPEKNTVVVNNGNSNSTLDELKKLSELRDSGVLTEAEFEDQKAKLLL